MESLGLRVGVSLGGVVIWNYSGNLSSSGPFAKSNRELLQVHLIGGIVVSRDWGYGGISPCE